MISRWRRSQSEHDALLAAADLAEVIRDHNATAHPRPVPAGPHKRLPNAGHPEWSVDDWHCRCGWFGNLGWIGYADHVEQIANGRPEAVPAGDERERIIERLSRAADGIKPEPSMSGSVGRYVGPITLDKAVAAIEDAIEYLASLSPGEDRLRRRLDTAAMGRALDASPKKREHHEDHDEGWSAWTCVPAVDAIGAAIDALSPGEDRLDVDDVPFPPLPEPPLVSERIAREVRLNVEAYRDALLASRPGEDWLREALEIISDGRHPDGHRGAVLVARAALEGRR